MRLVTVIVNYCTADHVQKGLEALVPQLVEVDCEAWVVDNHSPDDSAVKLQAIVDREECRGRVRLLRSPQNGGFGAGNNFALRKLLTANDRPDFVYFLNPDATPRPGVLKALLAFLDDHPNAGIAGTAVFGSDGAWQASRFRFPSLLSELEESMSFGPLSKLLASYAVTLESGGVTDQADWVSGASFAARTDIFDRVGFFDEKFFLYFEEVDLCRRVRAAGFEVWSVGDALVEHRGSVSTGISPQSSVPPFWFRSRAHYFRKNHGRAYLAAANAVRLIGIASRRVREVVGLRDRERPRYIGDFLRHGLRAPR